MQSNNMCRSAVFNLSLVVCCLFAGVSYDAIEWFMHRMTQSGRLLKMKKMCQWKMASSWKCSIQCCSHAFVESILCKMICTPCTVQWANAHTTGYLHSFCWKPTAMVKMWYRNISNYHRSIDNSNGILSDLDWFVHIICGGHINWGFKMSNGRKTTTTRIVL